MRMSHFNTHTGPFCRKSIWGPIMFLSEDGYWPPNAPKYQEILAILDLCQHSLEMFPTEEKYEEWRRNRRREWQHHVDELAATKVEDFKTFIYIMRCLRTGLYKIGRSKNPTIREKTLQSENPNVELVYQVEAFASYEKELHSEFSHKRVRGEWFRLTKKDLKSILSRNPPRFP